MQTLIDYTDKHNKGLSCNEYCICDIIYKLTKDDCIATINAISKESYTAEITTRKVINKLVDKGYLIRDSNKLLKVSSKWCVPIQSISDTKYQGSKVSLVPIQSITSTDTKYHIPIQSITSTDTKYHIPIQSITSTDTKYQGSKVSHEDNVPIQSITTENNTPLKNIVVNNQSTQHIKEKLYKYDKSFYENYLSIKNKKDDTDNISTDHIVGPVQDANTTSTEEYIPTQITVQINDIIELVKTKCKENNIMYTGKTKERFFAKHLLSDKFKKECLDIFPYTLNQFIEGIIPLSNSLKYAKTLSSAQDIYYNRANVINTAQKQKAQAQDQKTSIDLRTHK